MLGIDKTVDNLTGEKGIMLDLGVVQLNITLSVEGINTLTDTLVNTLKNAGADQQVNLLRLVDTIQQLGIENLTQLAQQGGQKEKDAIGRLFSTLQDVANQGKEPAMKLFQTLAAPFMPLVNQVQGAASEQTQH